MTERTLPNLSTTPPAEVFQLGLDFQQQRICELIEARYEEWRNRVPDEKPDWAEACTEILDAIERGEHHVA